MSRQAAMELLLAAATVLAAPLLVGVLYVAALDAPPAAPKGTTGTQNTHHVGALSIRDSSSS